MKNTILYEKRTKGNVKQSRKPLAGGLSDNALYVLVLAVHLKKLLGSASLSHFLATGEEVTLSKQES